MTQLLEERNIHLANFASFEKQAANGQSWIKRLRRAGIDRFEEAGFPTTRDEEWRFTNVAPIARTPFELAQPVQLSGSDPALAKFSFGNQAYTELVFVNGRFSRELSKLGRLPRGVTISSLAQVLQSNPILLERYLGRYADIKKDPFVALNTGFINDGAVVHLEAGTLVRHPIHLMFVSTAGQQPGVSHPRVLVVAEDNVHATIVESYIGATPGVYFTNGVTEIIGGDHVHLDHCKLQFESLDAYHIATMYVHLGRESSFVSHAATVGAKLSRNDLTAFLGGEYTRATLNGLVLIGGEQHADNHTVLRHEAPNCPSHELYKHVLDGRSSGVFKGKIFVQKDAQKTDSKQTSKSLLLSDDATMNSMPALEIYADDVKCTHGSTTGPVDEDMVFYLRTRGVSYEVARHLLTYAFAADITRRIKVEPVRRRLEDHMAAQHGLPQDLRITDLGSHDEAAL